MKHYYAKYHLLTVNSPASSTQWVSYWFTSKNERDNFVNNNQGHACNCNRKEAIAINKVTTVC